jgi:hypothetical protein
LFHRNIVQQGHLWFKISKALIECPLAAHFCFKPRGEVFQSFYVGFRKRLYVSLRRLESPHEPRVQEPQLAAIATGFLSPMASCTVRVSHLHTAFTGRSLL